MTAMYRSTLLLLGSALAVLAAPPQGSNCDIAHDGNTNSQDIVAGISVVGSLGAGTATQAIRARGLANVGYYEIGQKTLNAADWGKYGQIADPVQRGMQIAADQG